MDAETWVGGPQPVVPFDPAARRLAVALNGRYRVLRPIGAGATGQVFLGVQLAFGRPVALKVLSTDGAGDLERFAKRFRREAAAVAQLVHPNIVSVIDYGETSAGDLYLAMEYLPGRSLSEALADGPFSVRRALHVSLQLARALRKAHQQGLAHRDLKPANIIVATDEEGLDFAKVLDFGLVRLYDPDVSDLSTAYLEEELTAVGALLGTPGYMAPEQAMGDAVTGAADIYAMGVLLFQMLTGKLPYSAPTMVELITLQVAEDAPRLNQIGNLGFATELEFLVAKCLSRDPKARPDIDQLLLQLKRLWRAETDQTSATEIGLDALRAAEQALVAARQVVPLDLPRPRRPLRWAAWLLPLLLGAGWAAGGWCDEAPAMAPTEADSMAYKANPY